MESITNILINLFKNNNITDEERDILFVFCNKIINKIKITDNKIFDSVLDILNRLKFNELNETIIILIIEHISNFISEYDYNLFKRFCERTSIININNIISCLENLNNPKLNELITHYTKLIRLKQGRLKAISWSSESSESSEKFKYSKEQKKATKLLKKFIVDNNSNTFGLYGYAGTGKTSMIINYITDLISQKLIKSVVFTAPTNKAVIVLKDKFRNYLCELYNEITNTKDLHLNCDLDIHLYDLSKIFNVNINFMTIHKLLNLQSDYNDNGDIIFVNNSKDKSNIKEYDLIIVDECSMISQDIISLIFEELNKLIVKNSKVIFLGDPAQLPPVNETNSIIFDYSLISNNSKLYEQIKNMNQNYSFTLERIMRTDNDLISKLCYNFRLLAINHLYKGCY